VSRRAVVAALGLLAAALASPAIAADHDLDLAIEPSAVTWRDPVRLTVTDTRATACGSSAFTLAGRVDVVVPGVGRRIDLTLVESCLVLAPATIKTIQVSTDLGRLEPGPTTIRVTDQSSGRNNELPFIVRDPGRDRLTLPDVVTDAAAATLQIRALLVAFGSFTPPSTVTVHDRVVEVEVRTISPPPPITLPPPAFVQVVDFGVTLPVLAAGDYEIHVLDESESAAGTLVRARLHVWRAAGCLPSPTTLCLQDGRFAVTGTWRVGDGTTGDAHGQVLGTTDGSGVLWFFSPQNPELTIKLIDGCPLGGHWWVFLASGTNVEYTITVEDTATGHTKTYHNPLDVFPPLVTDTSAFTCS
jgi:hypothetical protein